MARSSAGRPITRVGPAFDYPWQPATPITSVCEDNEGNLVVGTGGDYVYWFNKDGIAEHVRNLSHATIMALCMDREGSLWVGTDGGGLNRVRRQSFEVVEFNRYAKSVSEDPQGNVWLASAGQIIQVTTNGAALLQLKAGALPDVGVVLALDSRHLFAGTVDGLFEIADGIPHSLSNPQVPGQISALHIDQSKTLWAGGRNGLTYLAPNGQSGATTVDSHPILDVQSITSDADGNLWIGTDGTGLYRLHDDKFQAFTRTNALPSDNVSYLYTDGAGVLWVATSGGLARYEKGKWTRYGKNEGLVNERIGYIIEDAHNFLWLGTTTGLIRAQKQELDDFAHGHTNALMFRGFGEGDGLPNSECSFGSQPGPCRTRDGKLWFPTILGVATVDPSKLTPNSNSPPVVIEAVRIDGKLQNQDTLRASPLSSLVVPPHSESLEIDYASLNLAAPEKGRIKFRLQGYETSWTERPSNQRSARYPQLPPNHYVFQVAACNEDGVWNEQGTALAITVLPPFWRTWWFLSLSILCLLGLIVGSVHYVSTQKLHRQLESLRQQEALERERARIARDLHDQLGANLTQVTLLGEMAEADKNLPQEVEAHAQQICQTARETTRSLDEIVWTVNPSNDTLEGS